MRTFVSFSISDEAKDYAYKLQKQINNPKLAKIKWNFKKNLHITLKFLGEVPEEKLEEVKQALKEVEFEPFELTTGNVGCFPSKRNPRVVWLALEPEKNAIALQQKVDEALLTVLPTDQKFKAHLTLGRVKLIKKKQAFVNHLENIETQEIKFTVKEFQLMKSQLKCEGPSYSMIENYPAKGF